MTIPTKAQIEAAIDLLVREQRAERTLIDGKPGLRLVKNLVGLSRLESEMMEEIKQLKIENAALTAAAEVGESELTRLKAECIKAAKEIDKIADRAEAEFKESEAATIERCAQWLKERDRSPHVHFLADKMCSALKEES